MFASEVAPCFLLSTLSRPKNQPCRNPSKVSYAGIMATKFVQDLIYGLIVQVDSARGQFTDFRTNQELTVNWGYSRLPLLLDSRCCSCHSFTSLSASCT